MDTQTKKKSALLRWLAICPVRHAIAAFSAVALILFFALRENGELMRSFCSLVVMPFHRATGRISNLAAFSIAELVYVILIITTLVYITLTIIKTIRRDGKLKRVYAGLMTLLMAALAIYTGYCVLWASMYYGDGCEEKSGLRPAGVGARELYDTALFFAETANSYSARVSRDENGLFAEPLDSVLDGAGTVYDGIAREFPFLDAPALKAKPMLFSRVMSYINFTGFFFPFTGEANVNTHAPHCLLPATIAHELAHQRGVAEEQEANFLAVAACMSSGDPAYIYSGALLAYIHLGNALHGADYELWLELYDAINDAVAADLRYNSEYWAGFKTKAAEASEAIYTGFLRSNGQSLGMRSYGACVDLLVAYYSQV